MEDMDAKRAFIAAALRVFRTVHIQALERTIPKSVDQSGLEDHTPDSVEIVDTQGLKGSGIQILPTDRWDNWVSY